MRMFSVTSLTLPSISSLVWALPLKVLNATCFARIAGSFELTLGDISLTGASVACMVGVRSVGVIANLCALQLVSASAASMSIIRLFNVLPLVYLALQ